MLTNAIDQEPQTVLYYSVVGIFGTVWQTKLEYGWGSQSTVCGHFFKPQNFIIATTAPCYKLLAMLSC